MRITKVKYNGSKVSIEYQQKRPDNEFDDFTMSSIDLPAPEFVDALNALALDVVGICELPEADIKALTVRGVSLTYTNDILGACITALKRLETANSPLVLNTPHLPQEDYGGGEGPILAMGTVDRLHTLLLEAESYINGNRAQASLLTESAAQDVEQPTA